MISKWSICVAVACAAMAVSAAAYAASVGTVEAELYGAPGWGNGAPGSYAPMSTDPRNICTGVYRLQINTAAGTYTGTGGTTIVNYASAANSAHTIDAFCSDIYQDAPTSFTTYNVMNLNDDTAIFGGISAADRGQKVADLYKLFANYSRSNWTDEQAAAFQSCVWEIINETPGTAYSVSQGAGTFYEIGAYWTGTANDWLTSLSSLPTVNQPGLDLFVLQNDESQDYSAVGIGVGTRLIPEPLTMLGLVASVGGVAGYIRNRRLAK
jgi:hypothetical protein